jgi:hypothetical protein
MADWALLEGKTLADIRTGGSKNAQELGDVESLLLICDDGSEFLILDCYKPTGLVLRDITQ